MNFIKKYNLNRHLNRFVKRKESENVQICALEKAQSICVLCTFQSPELLEETIRAVRSLKNGKNHVALYCYIPDKDNVLTNSDNDVCFISEEDFDFKGSLLKEKLMSLRAQSFDILIDLSKDTSLFALYLLGEIKAKFRIGNNEKSKKYYNLTLYSPHSSCTLIDYFQSIGHYTKKII